MNRNVLVNGFFKFLGDEPVVKMFFPAVITKRNELPFICTLITSMFHIYTSNIVAAQSLYENKYYALMGDLI